MVVAVPRRPRAAYPAPRLGYLVPDRRAGPARLYGYTFRHRDIGAIVDSIKDQLVVIATGFGIPVEIRELIVKVTPVRAGLLLINIVIVVYLVRQKKLFQLGEAPSQR
jgi:hypothetical protein